MPRSLFLCLQWIQHLEGVCTNVTLLTRAAQSGIVSPNVRQVAEVLDMIERLWELNDAVIPINHRTPDLFGDCKRVVVLPPGRKIADKPTAGSLPKEIRRLITGVIEVA